MKIKLCKDCKFYRTTKHPAYGRMKVCSKKLISPISGEVDFDELNVYQARRDYCGISAIYFELRNYEEL